MAATAHAWHEQPTPAAGSQRVVRAAWIALAGFLVATGVFVVAWINAGVSDLCIDLGDVGDPRCPEINGPSSLLTAARWVAWSCSATLTVSALVLATRSRRGHDSVQTAWLFLLGALVCGLGFSALVVTGPIATP